MFGFGSSEHMDLEIAVTAQDHASEALSRVGEQLRRVSEIAGGFTLGAIGYQAISEAVGGVEELGRSLITANATAEQLQQTFAAIYHSGAEAGQAMGWLTQFAMTAPFTRESIQQAGVTIAALGMDITAVMPALGNLSAVMGQQLPVAAQAFMDAYEGRFQMLQRDLHVSKQQLEEYGLQIDKTGKIVQSTFAPAFEAFVAKNYPQGMSLQMQTFNGQMSNFVDHLQLIERTMGHAAFEQLKTTITGLIDYMNTHQSQILGFAAAIGQDLAGAMQEAGAAAAWLMTNVPPAINTVAAVWGRLQGAVALAGGGITLVMAGIGNYLGSVLLPAVETSLGFMLHFWEEHRDEIATIVGTIGTNVQKFLAFVASNVTSYMTYIRGVIEVGWGVIEVVVGGALDLLSGNLDGFGKTWDKGWGMIWDGATKAVEGAAEIMIRLLANAFDSINSIEHTLYTKGQQIFGGIYALFASLEEPVIRLTHAIFQPFMDGFNTIMQTMHNLSTSAMGQFMHLPQVPALHMSMQTADQAIAAIHQAAATDNHPLGWAPGTGITSIPVDQAIARLRAMERQILGENAAETGGSPFTSAAAQKQGRDAFDAFIAGLRNLGAGGFQLPAGVDTAGLLGTGVSSLPVLGFGGPDAAAAAALEGHAAHAARAAVAAITGGPYAHFSGYQSATEGSTIAGFGLVQRDGSAQVIRHLQQLVTSLEQQLATAREQLTHSRLTAQATAATAGNTGVLARMAQLPVQGRDPRAAHALVPARR